MAPLPYNPEFLKFSIKLITVLFGIDWARSNFSVIVLRNDAPGIEPY